MTAELEGLLLEKQAQLGIFILIPKHGQLLFPTVLLSVELRLDGRQVAVHVAEVLHNLVDFRFLELDAALEFFNSCLVLGKFLCAHLGAKLKKIVQLALLLEVFLLQLLQVRVDLAEVLHDVDNLRLGVIELGLQLLNGLGCLLFGLYLGILMELLAGSLSFLNSLESGKSHLLDGFTLSYSFCVGRVDGDFAWLQSGHGTFDLEVVIIRYWLGFSGLIFLFGQCLCGLVLCSSSGDSSIVHFLLSLSFSELLGFFGLLLLSKRKFKLGLLLLLNKELSFLGLISFILLLLGLGCSIGDHFLLELDSFCSLLGKSFLFDLLLCLLLLKLCESLLFGLLNLLFLQCKLLLCLLSLSNALLFGFEGSLCHMSCFFLLLKLIGCLLLGQLLLVLELLSLLCSFFFGLLLLLNLLL